jgi:hypothetical protein
MAGMLWVTDREPGVRQLFAELLPDAEVLTPDELRARLALGQRPDGLVIDGTQLLELIPTIRDDLLGLSRMLICTGLPLASLPLRFVSRPTVAALAKPFCVDDLDAAAEWVRGGFDPSPRTPSPSAAVVQRRRPRLMRRLPAR